MYAIFVRIRVLPGTRAAFLAATAENQRQTRLEAGNLRFDVLSQLEDPDRIFFYEVYASEAAHRAHQQTPYCLRWREVVEPMMAERRSAERMQTLIPEPWA